MSKKTSKFKKPIYIEMPQLVISMNKKTAESFNGRFCNNCIVKIKDEELGL